MIKVGITGGIGSGKSTVCKVFEFLRIPVYSTDIEAKRLMNCDQSIIEALIHRFGKEVYTEDGLLNRAFLASKIFQSKMELKFVNSVVHPAVRKDFEHWAKVQNAPYVIQESALIFESKNQSVFDYVVSVSASEETRIERVVERDGCTVDDVKNRLKSQLAQDIKDRMATFVLQSDRNDLLLPQIIEIHNKILSNG